MCVVLHISPYTTELESHFDHSKVMNTHLCGGSDLCIYVPRDSMVQVYPWTQGVHFSHCLRQAWTMLGLFLFPAITWGMYYTIQCHVSTVTIVRNSSFQRGTLLISTQVISMVMTFHTCIWEEPSSYLSWHISYPDSRVICLYPSKCQAGTSIRP